MYDLQHGTFKLVSRYILIRRYGLIIITCFFNNVSVLGRKHYFLSPQGSSSHCGGR